MKFVALLALLSVNAFAAAPDRQFVCKFPTFDVRAAIFVNVSADGLRLKSLRLDSNSGGEVFDVSLVPQFRYSSVNGREDFYALCPDNSTNAFALQFSGNRDEELRGFFSQMVLDENGVEEPADVGNNMPVLCQRIL